MHVAEIYASYCGLKIDSPHITEAFYPLDIVDYITISSTGDATDFGDLTTAASNGGTASNSIRAVSAGGGEPSVVNNMEYFTIASTGDASDFGDLSVARQGCSGFANGHGGLA